ncbi:MAG: NAD/NADP octopine/nopaline dehydrogenase family protein [Gordonia sp. (in: high G+C Gram-positive bacteria)]
MSYAQYVSDVNREVGGTGSGPSARGAGWPTESRREPFGWARSQSFAEVSGSWTPPRRAAFGQGGVETVAVIGDGPIADELAARAAGSGWSCEHVPLFTRDASGIADIRPATLKTASLILIALPPSAQPPLSVLLAGCFHPGALVVLVPGQPGGAGQIACGIGSDAEVTVAETSWSPWFGAAGGRLVEVGPVPLATVPARDAAAVSARLAPLMSTVPVIDTRWTALHAPDVVLRTAPLLVHPAPDSQTLGELLAEPAVARMVAAVDAERGAIARALRLDIPSATEWIGAALGTSASSLSSALGELAQAPSPGRYDAYGPRDLVPYGLVPLLALAEQAGVAVPAINGLIDLADQLLVDDHRLGGRNRVRTEVGRS